MLNLDTHVLLYALAGELTRRETTLLSREAWSISAIVIWGIGKLAELGRIERERRQADRSGGADDPEPARARRGAERGVVGRHHKVGSSPLGP